MLVIYAITILSYYCFILQLFLQFLKKLGFHLVNDLEPYLSYLKSKTIEMFIFPWNSITFFNKENSIFTTNDPVIITE